MDMYAQLSNDVKLEISKRFADQNFPVAENIVDWCMNPQFSGSTQELWPRHLYTLIEFFGDACYLCSDMSYMENMQKDTDISNILNKLVLLQHGVCPKCGRSRNKIMQEHGRESYYEFVGVWGMRTGKSYLCSAVIVPYILHHYFAIPDIRQHFNLPSNTILKATLGYNTSALWELFTAIYTKLPWFRNIIAHLTEVENTLNVKLIYGTSTSITFPSRHLEIDTLRHKHQPNPDAVRFLVANEEAAWCLNSELFNKLNNSLTLVRRVAEVRRQSDRDTIDAYMISISTPRDSHDILAERKAKAIDDPRIYVSHLPTWKIVPFTSKEDLEKEMSDDDPKRFLRDFEAVV